MKKTFILALILLFSPDISDGAVNFLKLRTNHHPEFLRIVLEGHDSIISNALVHQRGQSIVVNYPDSDFVIQAEKVLIVFNRVDNNTVIFYPGDFRGLKVFYLKNPNRLVIDVYLKKEKKPVFPSARPPVLPGVPPPDSPVVSLPGKEEKSKVSVISTVVIDPGHGGYESGLVEGIYREKSVALDIARKLMALINKGTTRSFLTRGSDRFMSQTERVKFSNKRDADIFISLHIGKHDGIVIYLPVLTESVSDIVKPHLANKGQEKYLKESETLLNAMKEAVAANFDADTLSVKPLPYSILSRIESAALLIELPSFEDAYYIEELKEEMANTLYKGIYIYEEIKTK